VALSPCGYKILVELLVRSRAKKIVEVGYVFRSRERGESKASFRVFVDYVQHLFRLRAPARALKAERRALEMEGRPLTADRK
jgi:hypothetical protein